MHRKGPRLTRILAACAAVPVILTAAACSSDSGSGDGADAGKSDSGSKSSASPSGKSSAAAVQPAAFKTLPEPCKALSGKTVEDLVSDVDDKNGTSQKSDDIASRGSCYWKGLDSNGTKGSQFRWLNISLLRYDSNATLGSGEKLAKEQMAKRVAEAKAMDGAKNVKTEPLKGVGDEATLVRYDQKKKEGDFKNQRVVARVENAVVVLDYNGAGLAGAGDPDAKDMAKDAEKAAKEAVTAVTEANESKASSGATQGKDEEKSTDSDKASGSDSDSTSDKSDSKKKQ
ncbi:DUF3558 domain-containing protein [Streptomyces sp. NPDC002851]